MAKSFDIVIFGASGYTGKYAVKEAIEILHNYKWAIAGRNMGKLEKTIKDVEIFTNTALSNVPIIIADINDDKSLRDMTAQAKVIVNCCGPYRFYGEQVVKACIETKTNHVDVSGEPQYMETMQLKYNDAAREKGVYIVSACGFDSIPADMGTVFLQKQFNGTVNSVEIYLSSYFLNGYEPKGAGVHFATFESAVYGFTHANELKDIRKQLFRTRMPRLKPLLKEKSKLHKAKEADDRWCLSIPTADHSVIMRSQRHFYEHERQRPLQIRSYTTFESLSNAIKSVLAGLIFRKYTEYNCGKNLLLKYPEFFSFGFASHEGPTEIRNANTKFETLFVARGWNEKFENPNEEITIPMNKKMITRAVCNNPFYGAASKAALLSAVTIIDESQMMPFKGGVFSPAAAFKNTNLIEKLQHNGFIFEVVKTEELKAKL
ncbi:hypothetical protein PVAND_003991 [Polypedilum vanderplanki]|uniref:Saccharopine dehydrogenase NADP binding domain-containing protein n=1 Tax=Polypedilum vanderplanki TaxID=319348 RepID=A0A9J6BVT5_POLVA|nr:hypothetical protein PVAND_003991 [Polypedilum vanderplanki]